MLCQNCHKENRLGARFCKWCGTPMDVTEDYLSKVVGRSDIKQQLKSIVDIYSYLRNRETSQGIRLSVNTIIIGETGTGKTMFAELLKDYFYQHKIISKPKLKVVDAVNFQRFVENWDKNIAEIKGGLLFFDNVQKLLPDSYSKNVNPLDKLFVEMGHWKDDPIVVLSGLPGGFEEFLDNNPSERNRFKYLFRLPGYNCNELEEITKSVLKEKYGLTEFSPEAESRLRRLFKYAVKTKDESFGNAHYALQVAEDIFTSFITHASTNGTVLDSDIVGYVPEERTLDDILGEMDEFIGMENVKQAVREIAWEVQANVERANRGLISDIKPPLHFILTGNPGTGKTSIARKLGEIFEAIGYLETGHVVEVDRSQMVSQYMGETPKVVDKLCDKAVGGILFIDEAYTLAPQHENGTKDEQGIQALEKLMKRMEDDRGKFVVIAAGYRAEMENLLRVNPGMRSRFNRFLHIDDYSPEMLYEILLCFARKKQYCLSENATVAVKEAINQIYACRDKNFANGREMRQLFEKITRRQAERINKIPMSEQTNEMLLTIEAEDVPLERPKTVDYKGCLDKLDGLVGLSSVKNEIANIAAYLNVQAQRGELNAGAAKHYIFTGNPGTGKTTVARIMADVLLALGVVAKGQLVEADRSKLVAGFVGQTAIKTNQLIDSALGGVLFIDEAYTLCQGESDSFGKEALDTLLKRLEDDRGKFICIVAGYTNEMHDFIASNPGLKSRFTQTITFDDYNPEELTQIFKNLVASKNLSIDADTATDTLHYFEKMYISRDKNFGNAREVRRVFDEAVARQSRRLVNRMTAPDYSEDEINWLKIEDIRGVQTTEKKSLDEVMTELEEFVGMKTVKEAVRRLAVQTVFLKKRIEQGIGSAENIPVNIVLTGNPGTGKTSVARKMGEVFQAVGLLPSSKVVEVNRSQMVGQYLGETPKIVNRLCDQAMGGVLFIDEAYSLTESADGSVDKYGKEAVEALMKRMEDDKGKFGVIAAGYKDEMTRFLSVNPGLASRFTMKLNIEDYNEMELLSIFKKMAEKKKYVLSPDAEAVLVDIILKMYFLKDAKTFGNARAVRQIFDSAVQQLSIRVSSMPIEEVTAETYQRFLPEDFKGI